METYKKTLKNRILLLAILVIFSVSFGIYDMFLASTDVDASFILGFQSGAASGIGFLAVLQIFRYSAALKDEKKMQLQYNKENDERLKAIRAKAGMPMLLIVSIMMIVAGIILGYFNTTIFITLVVAAVCQMTIGAIVKMVYMSKM